MTTRVAPWLPLTILLAALAAGASAGEDAGADRALVEWEALYGTVEDLYVAFEKAQEPSEENGRGYGDYYRNLYDPGLNPRVLAVARVERFEERHRGTLAGLKALVTGLRYASYNGALVRRKALHGYNLLLKHYTAFEEAGEICYLGDVSSQPRAYLDFLDKLIAATAFPAVRARATVARMVVLNRLGDRVGEGLAADRILAEFPDALYKNTPAGELARRWLKSQHDKTSLRPGLRAPELEGRDVDGNPLKLSDFRGKVTVVVFWGWW